MTLEEECALSYYRPISELNEEHGVYLVQHTLSKQIFVKKELSVYNADVYRYLKTHRIVGTPYIYEVVEDEDRHTLTVIEEYVSGQTLERVLDEKGTLPEAQAVQVTLCLCGILRQMHEAIPAIIHRDVKPSNVILTQDGAVRLLDMNAAKQFRTGEVEDTQLIGTFGYAAPEQYGFGASGAQTDIYALGVLLNVMVTGVLPKERLAGGRLGAVVTRCTQIEPKNRYRSVGEVAAALGGSNASQVKPRWRRYLPPGFRAGDPGKEIAVTFLYAFFLIVCFSLTVEGGSAAQSWSLRIAMFVNILLIVLFSTNYCDIWKKLRLTGAGKPKPSKRKIFLIDILIFLVCMVLLYVFEKAFHIV